MARVDIGRHCWHSDYRVFAGRPGVAQKWAQLDVENRFGWNPRSGTQGAGAPCDDAGGRM